MKEKQDVHGRGPSNINHNHFACSFDVSGLNNHFPLLTLFITYSCVFYNKN